MDVMVGLLGASGFVGGELLRLLAAHPVFRPTRLFADSHAGQGVAHVHPHLAPAYPAAKLQRFSPAALDGLELIFAALPHGMTQALAPRIVERDVPFVDLGADFRMQDPAAYRKWYGEEHQAPELLPRFVYGIPEINRNAIRNARCVAAAGCYPTAAILALRPLLAAGLVKPQAIIVDAASGVSGAGRKAQEATAFNSVAESFTAYGLLDHRHTGEIEQALAAKVLFTPHLAPMNRGILATCYAQATGEMAPDEPLRALQAAYAAEPFVHVAERAPATKWAAGCNAVQLTARYDPRTSRVVALAALDNLGKGAAGQMIQCANLMFGLDETAGLSMCGVYP